MSTLDDMPTEILSLEEELKLKTKKELKDQLNLLETLIYDYQCEVELIIDEMKRRGMKI